MFLRRRPDPTPPPTWVPDVPRREVKSDRYMLAHLILPAILFQRPAEYRRALEADGSTYIRDVWQAMLASWGVDAANVPADGMDVRRYVNDAGDVVLVIQPPPPQAVPEAHVVVVMLAPQRRFFVVEMATDQVRRKHRRSQWIVRSSAPLAAPSNGEMGWLCEWLPDNSRRNYAMIDYGNDVELLAQVSVWSERPASWRPADPADLERARTVDPTTMPTRAAERPLAPDIKRSFDAAVDAILREQATGDAEIFDKAVRLRRLIEESVAIHGNGYAEFTLRTMDVIRLLVQCGRLYDADALVRTWRNFCHRYRGNRAPETRVACSADALVAACDVDLNEDARCGAVTHHLSIRDSMSGQMRPELPGAADVMLTASCEEILAMGKQLTSTSSAYSS